MSLDILSRALECVKLGDMTLIQLLRDHFDRTNEEQAAFARRLGLKPQTVSQLLAGDIKVPKAWIRRKLAAEFGLRHIDILVMVGELASDEIDPAKRPGYADFRLREIAETWPRLSPDAQVAVSESFRSLIRVPGVLNKDVENPVAAAAR